MNDKEIALTKRIQVLSELTSRAKLAAKLGYSYDDERDLYEALGYPQTIEYDNYAARYGRQDIARAIINRPIQYTWKGEFTLSEAGDDKETALEKEWKELSDRLKLKSKFVRLDKLSSIGNYGVLLLGFDDVQRREDWATPVNPGKRNLLYVKPLGQGHAKIASYIDEPSNPRFGMVEQYDIEITSPHDPSTKTDSTTSVFKAHYSRVIHVVPELMESEIEGEPVLRSVFNRLLDLEKLVGGSAEMFWRGARPGYVGKADPDFELDDDTEDTLEAQLDEYEHKLRRFIVASGIDIKALEMQVANPKDHVDVIIQMICAVTGIPKRILTGSERGELASTQDITSWYSIIQMRRDEHAAPNIIRAFADYMIELKILPKPSTGEYDVQWEDLYAASDSDQAEVGRTRAEALKAYYSSPLASENIPVDVFIERFLGFDQEEAELINEQVEAARMESIAEEQERMEEEEPPEEPNEPPIEQ